MLETFVIDGIRVEIEVSCKNFSAELLEVTSFTDSWRTYIHSGYRFLRIQGKPIGENEINKTFQIIAKKEEVLILKSLGNQ
jgi:hypothetical protein